MTQRESKAELCIQFGLVRDDYRVEGWNEFGIEFVSNSFAPDCQFLKKIITTLVSV